MDENEAQGQSEVKDDKAKKKKDKKKEKEKEKKEKEKEKKESGGKKKNKQAELIKELLKRRQEQEEEQKRQEEEEERRQEEKERQKEEQERIAQEKKEEVKRRKAELIQKQKREGTYLTKKQKQERAKAQRLFDNQSIIAPTPNEEVQVQKVKKPYYGKKKQQKKTEEEGKTDEAHIEEEGTAEREEEEEEEADNEVAESWEEIADEAKRQSAEQQKVTTDGPGVSQATTAALREKPMPTEKPSSDAEEEESSSATSSDEEEEEDESSVGVTIAKETREDLFARVRAKITKRKELANSKRSVSNLRSPVICVLGHVDTGKTKMLDTIRRSNVQEGEAGGITQQMGATRVPGQAIKERSKMVKNFCADSMQIPGFLIIDTPGHESFANMRSRGSSLCDFAILVVDIMHGLEPQTIESLKLLIKRQTPFVVALNKVDRLYGYESNPRKDIWQHLKSQPTNAQLEFKERFDKIVGEFSEQAINIALANKNVNFDEYISVVPTSAFHGDGIGNLMAHIVEQCQTRHAQRLAFSEELECIVMEVRSLPGLGTTIDVILINGTLRVNDIMVLTGSDGPIATPIRDLLMPQPLKEIRVKNDYEHYKEIGGAQGVKILAKGLEKAIAGLPLYVATTEEELEVLKEDAEVQLKHALMAIKKKSEGVYVQASTLGSLEALLEFLKAQKIPYSNVNIGPVHKKDVQRAAAMLEHNVEYACILAFDVPVDREVQMLADKEGVRIFQANIIYHLEDSFLNFRKELALKQRRENEHLAIFPCKLRIMPQHVFKSRDPIVCGVSVEAGQLKKGTPIAAKTKDEVILLGTVSSIERNHEQIDIAKAGDEICIKIENTTGDAPRLYGRHFNHEDILISRISRESIDVCKNYFRDDLTKTDWALMIQLKKILQIL
ncbi:hypothetical protein niasHT_022682 [Heterodera trifolii]|uniref:Eukaryotic translation initiation factor 5B n=1 Tax=Heterodera trifolii TaxID=157864 RepID=A0ABD2JRM5_9BILA